MTLTGFIRGADPGRGEVCVEGEVPKVALSAGLGAWEKLRRAVPHLLVPGTAAQDLLPRAKLLLVAAMVARRKAAGAIS